MQLAAELTQKGMDNTSSVKQEKAEDTSSENSKTTGSGDMDVETQEGEAGTQQGKNDSETGDEEKKDDQVKMESVDNTL